MIVEARSGAINNDKWAREFLSAFWEDLMQISLECSNGKATMANMDVLIPSYDT